VKRVLLAACLVWLTACSHPDRLDDAVLVPPQLTFYQLEANTGSLHLFWHEWPYYADTRLNLVTPLADCASIAVYVNPEGAQLNLLSTQPTTVAPLKLRDSAEEMEKWYGFPAERCAVMVCAGYILDAAFMGLSFSTRDGVFHREFVTLTRERQGAWQVHPLTGVAEQLHADFPELWYDREVTVSFDFPDGHREETTLMLAEAAEILEGPFYQGTTYHLRQPWNSVRFWTRAALAKLDLDFREQEVRGPGGLMTNQLVSVEGVGGNWTFDPRDGRPPHNVLYSPAQALRYLRFSITRLTSGDRAAAL
jgi:hypothetical protein